MDNKISIGRLTAMLAIATGKQKRLCEDFIKELFQIVASELENGESIRIKGFGTFRLVEVEARKSVNVATGEENRIPSYKKVSFTPSKELAAAVNRPFEDFMAVEISDDLSTEELLADEVEISEDVEIADEVVVSEDVEIDGEPAEVAEEEPQTLPDGATVTDQEGEIDVEPENPAMECSPELEAESEEESMAEDASAEAYSLEDGEYGGLDDEDMEKRGRSHFIWGAVVGFIAACVAGAVVFIIWGDALFGHLTSQEVGNFQTVVTDTSVLPETVSADSLSEELPVSEEPDGVITRTEEKGNPVATVPSDAVVVDTVTTTRYLTTIAREHYGNFNLWPLIYKENEKVLGHPDRIRPGTKVVVPPLSKFGIDPKNPKDVEKIKQKGIEIYSRYKK